MRKIFFYNLLVVILILIFLEIFLRLFTSVNLLGFEKNLFNSESNFESHNSNIESIAYGKKVFTDRFGFRVPKKNYSYNKKNGSILIVGDSVSFGVGVIEEETVVGLIRNNFKHKNIYNASVTGNTLDSYNKSLPIYEKNLKFDDVLIFFCLNDIIKSKGVITRKEFYKKNNFLTEVNIVLRGKSFLYVYLKSVLTDPEKRYFDYIAPIYKENAAIQNLKKTISEINYFSISRNKKLHFIILPYEFQTRKKNCNKNYLFPQEEINKILTKKEIKFNDFSKEFCNHKDPKKLFLTHDPVHLSKAGHQFVYNLIKKNF